jgi:hypothetical protein
MYGLYVFFDEVTYYFHLVVVLSSDFLDHKQLVILHWCKYLEHYLKVLQIRNDVLNIHLELDQLFVLIFFHLQIHHLVHLEQHELSLEILLIAQVSRSKNKIKMFFQIRNVN